MPNSILNTRPLTPDQLRISIDASNQYEQWIEQKRLSNQFAGWMTWREKNGVEYLTEGFGSIQKSRGRRSPETERIYNDFVAGKERAQAGLKVIEERLAERALMAKALKMGRILAPMAKIIREYDVHGLMGRHLMVVGTHAIEAYEALAGRRFDASLAATEDLDFAWLGRPQTKADLLVKGGSASLLKHLKSVDSTFTVNTERTFQVRNAKGVVIDFITDTEGERNAIREALKPIAIEGQEWLLRSEPVDAVAFDMTGFPLRLFAPDPRVFACHKLWIAKQPDRTPLKREKDYRQGIAVAQLTCQYLPMYRFDAGFLKSLPEPLLACFQEHLRPILKKASDQEFSM